MSVEKQFEVIARVYFQLKSEGRRPKRPLTQIGADEFGLGASDVRRIQCRLAQRRKFFGPTSEEMITRKLYQIAA